MSLSESPHYHALELAIRSRVVGETDDATVVRARKYHGFLTQTPTTTTTAAAAAAKPAATTATTATTATAAKPATTTTATPAKPAGRPPGRPPKTATTATTTATPKYSLEDVAKALREVAFKPGAVAADPARKQVAFDILKEQGGGVTTARDLKPALYDAVVAACKAEAAKLNAPASADDEMFGGVPDTSGAQGEDLDADLPENGAGDTGL